MRLVADLHIHSHYSLATSPKLRPEYLDRWARIKGIGLVGTGDCTHPAWLAELRERLEPAYEGLFRLKSQVRRAFDEGEALAEDLPEPSRADGSPAERGSREGPLFVLSGEISTIYSSGGKTRKVHHLVLLPDFAAAAAFQARLERVGSIRSDGRPILGIDSRDLLELLLEADERSILIPAHIWTPWFSALGARSGFDSIEECYRDLSPRIRAIETGLSSNPPMNWAVAGLDRFAIISNSDAHSPEKLGREASLVDIEPGFPGLAEALAGGGRRGALLGTVEFFPQEGKYHYDGHRACGVSLSPEESAARGGLCPVCGKPLTPGVMGRVAQLADRPVDDDAPCPEPWKGTNRRPYRSLIPLKELVAELLGSGEGAKKVATAYSFLVARAGSEFDILLDRPLSELEAAGGGKLSGELLAAAIGRMREGKVSIVPGYDGEYGRVRAFAPGEDFPERGAAEKLFGDEPPSRASVPAPEAARRGKPGPKTSNRTKGETADPAPAKRAPVSRTLPAPSAQPRPSEPIAFALDPEQARIVDHRGGPALVLAGPGTGKTAVLALRIARLLEKGRAPDSIVALTFTTKAAGELRERIARSRAEEGPTSVWTGTFHAFCRSLLREHADRASLAPDFLILGEEERDGILAAIAPARRTARRLGAYIEGRKRFLLLPGEEHIRLGPGSPAGLAELAAELGLPPLEPELDSAYAEYRRRLRAARLLDFDDLVAGAVRLLAADRSLLSDYRRRIRALFVDEYQDVNFAQYALVRLLAPDSSSELFAIGDPNQAIYGFRGSDRRFIERFLSDYPEAALYRLERSFRCAPGIIGAAASLVGARLSGTGQALALARCEYPSEASEAEGIAREIDRLIGGTRFFAYDSGIAGPGARRPGSAGGGVAEKPSAVTPEELGAAPEPDRTRGSEGSSGEAPGLRSLGECAILVRAAALAPPIEKALFDHGIPYQLVGTVPWWEEEPCRSTLALLREAVRPGEYERRFLERGPGRAPDDADADADAGDLGPTAADAAGGAGDSTMTTRAEEAAPGDPGSAARTAALRSKLCGLGPAAAVLAAAEALGPAAPAKAVSDQARGKVRQLRRESDELGTVLEAMQGETAGRALQRLAELAAAYGDLASFLDDLALFRPQDGYAMRSERVALMTIHAAKGLEFDHVFIAGLEDGLLPFTLYGDGDGIGDEADSGESRIEEERRLLFVAMTRARVGLHLSWARSRHFHGRGLKLPPSRFLERIEELVPRIDPADRRLRNPQLKLF